VLRLPHPWDIDFQKTLRFYLLYACVCVCVCVCPCPGLTYMLPPQSCFVSAQTHYLSLSRFSTCLIVHSRSLSPLLPPEKFHDTNAKCIIAPTKSAGMSKSITSNGYQAHRNRTNFPNLDVEFPEFCQLRIESRNQTPDIDPKRLRHSMVKLPLVWKLDIV